MKPEPEVRPQGSTRTRRILNPTQHYSNQNIRIPIRYVFVIVRIQRKYVFLPYKHGCPANTEMEEAADNLQKYRRPLFEARLTDERRTKATAFRHHLFWRKISRLVGMIVEALKCLYYRWTTFFVGFRIFNFK